MLRHVQLGTTDVLARPSRAAMRAVCAQASEVELYTSPDGVVVRIEGPVELADITALLGPSVEVLIQVNGLVGAVG